MKFWRLAVRR